MQCPLPLRARSRAQAESLCTNIVHTMYTYSVHISSRYSRAPHLPGTHLDEEQRRGLVDRRTQLNHVYTKRGPAQGSCYMLRPLHDFLLRYAQLTGCIARTRDRDTSSGSTATDWCYSVPDRGKAAGTALGPTHAQ